MQGRKQNALVYILSGCLVILIFLMCTGTSVLIGLYLYDRYGLPEFVVNAAEVTGPSLAVTPEAALQAPTLPTLAPPIAGVENWPTPLPTLPPSESETDQAIVANTFQELDNSLPVTLDQYPIPNNAYAYLERLYLADHPAHDYYNSAVHLGKLEAGPRAFNKPSFEKGSKQVFKTEDGDVTATLVAVTEHAYFWIDDNLEIPEELVTQAATQLEENYYSRVNQLFGQPWAPGIDGDPRFSILHLASVGNLYELGYFSDQDEYPKSLFRNSNEQELVYLNMDQLEIGSELYYGTLVHELQHLFQWNLDKNEDTWFNEGMSQLAELYAGLGTVVPDPYLNQPEIRLDRWSYEDYEIDAHYGASFLFLTYLWEQLGEGAVYELIRHPANGLIAVHSVLQAFQPERSLESFMGDWAAATFLDDPFAGDHFAYTMLDLPPAAVKKKVQDLPFKESGEIEQFGIHYIDIDRNGAMTITFAGDTTAQLIDAAPTSGEQMWYAVPSNDSDTQLTANFDLSQLNSATLTFSAWYDLEEDYDFAYVSVSTDQGQTWDILPIQHSQSGHYGPAFSGKSVYAADAVNGWVRETLSLNQYAGQQILLRFHVLTDFETTGRGFALDDIAISELGFYDSAESGTGQWDAQGFVRTGWLLPQQWIVRLIHNGNPASVESLSLNPLNQGHLPIYLEEGGTLVIMPLTPFVDETAQYWLQVD
jgi:immune inhibitor A